LQNRLRRLEDQSRERAVGALKELWDSLTDRELALFFAPYHGAKLTNTQEQERVIAERKLWDGGRIEKLLEVAVRSEGCSEEEIGRRVKEITHRAVLDGRAAGPASGGRAGAG
jgi:hypothetical protein